MSLKGKSEQREQLTAILDAEKLVRLASDLLVCRGHSQIRNMDGPGDGGRDVHSISKLSQRQLTQCKFHQDTSRTCSSSELSQLPMAMIKLDYSVGLFVTNATISPQAKREYIDNYPRLALEFIDGDDLIDEVFANALLRALWLDGKESEEINRATAFPVIIRRHEDDLPIALIDSDDDLQDDMYRDLLSADCPHTRVHVRPAHFFSNPFEPYRAPEPLSSRESGMPFILGAEIVVEGDLGLAAIQDASEKLGSEILSRLDAKHGNATARVGIPYICSLKGGSRRLNIPTNVAPVSFLRISHTLYSENDWFAVEPSESWSHQCDARVTEMDSVRLYSFDLDCCIAYEIESRIGAHDKAVRESLREVQMSAWQQSLFCLIPPWAEWNEFSIPEPDDTVVWPWDGRVLCGWFCPPLLGGLVQYRSDDSLLDVSLDHEVVFEEKKRMICECLLDRPGVEFLEPNKARHMVALVGDDPFPHIDTIKIRTADIVAYPETIPSPIRPESRRFVATVAWKTDMSADDLFNVVRDLRPTDAGVRCEFGPCIRYGEYVSLEVRLFPTELKSKPTVLLLETIHSVLADGLALLESVLKEDARIERCGREFWRAEHGVNLGVPYRLPKSLFPSPGQAASRGF